MGVIGSYLLLHQSSIYVQTPLFRDLRFLTQLACFRPYNVSKDIPNMYFAGAGIHPGGGLPGVVTSGKIVAQLIGNLGKADETGDSALEQIEH